MAWSPSHTPLCQNLGYPDPSIPITSIHPRVGLVCFLEHSDNTVLHVLRQTHRSHSTAASVARRQQQPSCGCLSGWLAVRTRSWCNRLSCCTCSLVCCLHHQAVPVVAFVPGFERAQVCQLHAVVGSSRCSSVAPNSERHRRRPSFGGGCSDRPSSRTALRWRWRSCAWRAATAGSQRTGGKPCRGALCRHNLAGGGADLESSALVALPALQPGRFGS